jgi:hypothetical protein
MNISNLADILADALGMPPRALRWAASDLHEADLIGVNGGAKRGQMAA